MKPLFSQRKGLKPIPSAQKEEWDKATVITVWDTIDAFITHARGKEREFIVASLQSINLELLKKPKDEFFDVYSRSYNFFDGGYDLDLGDVKSSPYRQFYFDAPYNERLDFIELFLKGDGTPEMSAEIAKVLNTVFERRGVAYRIVSGIVTDIDDENERAAVEEAGQESSYIKNAATHLYSREKPDYKNAIKESILAVEEVCKEITGKPKATLEDCLRVIDDKAQMHGAFKEALTKLYGYTSDESGIRHAGLSGGDVAFEEAKFMLVACSVFCNYLRAKQTKL